MVLSGATMKERYSTALQVVLRQIQDHEKYFEDSRDYQRLTKVFTRFLNQLDSKETVDRFYFQQEKQRLIRVFRYLPNDYTHFLAFADWQGLPSLKEIEQISFSVYSLQAEIHERCCLDIYSWKDGPFIQTVEELIELDELDVAFEGASLIRSFAERKHLYAHLCIKACQMGEFSKALSAFSKLMELFAFDKPDMNKADYIKAAKQLFLSGYKDHSIRLLEVVSELPEKKVFCLNDFNAYKSATCLSIDVHDQRLTLKFALKAKVMCGKSQESLEASVELSWISEQLFLCGFFYEAKSCLDLSVEKYKDAVVSPEFIPQQRLESHNFTLMALQEKLKAKDLV